MRLATKRIASLTCAAALMFSLAACSSSASTASSSESAGGTSMSAPEGTPPDKPDGAGGTAVENNAVVTTETGSTWTLTGDCTLTSLTNNGTINFNGHTITLADGTVLK